MYHNLMNKVSLPWKSYWWKSLNIHLPTDCIKKYISWKWFEMVKQYDEYTHTTSYSTKVSLVMKWVYFWTKTHTALHPLTIEPDSPHRPLFARHHPQQVGRRTLGWHLPLSLNHTYVMEISVTQNIYIEFT